MAVSIQLFNTCRDRFFYYYWVNGQTLVGPETQADKYPNVKPISWEDFFSSCPAEQLPGSFGALIA